MKVRLKKEKRFNGGVEFKAVGSYESDQFYEFGESISVDKKSEHLIPDDQHSLWLYGGNFWIAEGEIVQIKPAGKRPFSVFKLVKVWAPKIMDLISFNSFDCKVPEALQYHPSIKIIVHPFNEKTVGGKELILDGKSVWKSEFLGEPKGPYRLDEEIENGIGEDFAHGYYRKNHNLLNAIYWVKKGFYVSGWWDSSFAPKKLTEEQAIEFANSVADLAVSSMRSDFIFDAMKKLGFVSYGETTVSSSDGYGVRTKYYANYTREVPQDICQAANEHVKDVFSKTFNEMMLKMRPDESFLNS